MHANTIGHIEADDPLAGKGRPRLPPQPGHLRLFHHRDHIGAGQMLGRQAFIGIGAGSRPIRGT